MAFFPRVSLLSTIIRIKFRKYRESVTKLVLDKISKNQLLIPFLYLLLQKISKNHLAGGLSGYRYFYSKQFIWKFFDRSIVRGLWASTWNRQKKSVEWMDKYVVNKSETHFSELLKQNEANETDSSSKLNILSLLPAGWARSRDEIGFPHSYHIISTAKIADVKLVDLATNKISANPKSHEEMIKELEWQSVEKAITQFLPNILLISGHKRSFDSFNKKHLIHLKSKYNFKVLLLLLDDWSIEYVEMIENWGEAIDKVLIYEENCVVTQKISYNKLFLWPFPRLVPTNQNLKVFNYESLRIRFFGSVYLNRIPWLTFIKRICSKYPNLVLEVNSGAKASQYSLNVGQYLDSYSQSEITIHFLERTPGVFTFTSSVWDAFAGGSLVIAQVGSEFDPISTFFRPGIDYLPFASLSELSNIIDELYRFPDLVTQIASSGRDFMLSKYSPKRMYSYLARELL